MPGILKKTTAAIISFCAIIAFSGCGKATTSPTVTATPAPSLQGATGAIPPQTEAYLHLAWEDKTEREKYNTPFTGRTEADLDGDGKADTIELLPEKEGDAGDDESRFYQSITVKINGIATTVETGEDKAFIAKMEMGAARLSGYILDIDAKDGRKEVCIYDSEAKWPESHLITYDGKTVKEIYTPDSIRANGTGYILAYEEFNSVKLAGARGMNILRIKRFNGERFQNVPARYFRTVYTGLPESRSPAQAAETQWDQRLAKNPGGEEDVAVKAGTEVFFGVYAPEGWMEVSSVKGETLGWLDCRKVDWNLYTGNVYHPDFGKWRVQDSGSL